MNNNVDWNLLAKYIFGEASDEERAEVEAWVGTNPDREALLRQLREIREKTSQPLSNQWNSDAFWKRFQKHIDSEEKELEHEEPEARQPRATRSPTRERRAPVEGHGADSESSAGGRRTRDSRSTVRHVWRTAATVAVVAVVAFALVQLQGQGLLYGLWERDARVLTTQKGEQEKIQLTDETVVHLNADTRLTLHSGFGQGTREVSLRGEAYFDVARDTSRPFRIHTSGTTTEVLGTKFDVNAYDEEVQVVVTEGRVVLRPRDSQGRPPTEASEQGRVLQAGQMGSSSESVEIVVDTTAVALDRYLAWTKGWLVFKDAPFGRVVRRIERWYNLEINVSDSLAVDGHLNAKFSDRWSPSEVLSTIATVFELRYKRHDRMIWFFPAEESP